MYTDFFNLKEKPFNLTPSPRFLCLGESHKEALALLTYGVIERKGFILLTGEVGTGKTTIIQTLLSNLDSDIEYIYLSNPLFSPKDFMNYLAFTAFKKKPDIKSKAEFLVEFEDFLKERLQHQKNLILIIDEAQNLSFRLLEEIRLLSNMETAEKKLINIFLVGQPELNDKLSQSRCRPLLQRIGIRYHIEPLGFEGTREYMATRLKVAGADDVNSIFSKSVIKAIYQYSQGYPRMINVLADNALLVGYSNGKRKITPLMIKECFQDMRPEADLPRTRQEKIESVELEQVTAASSGRYWKWAAALFFALAAALVINGKGQDIIGRLTSLIPVRIEEGLAKFEKKVSNQVVSAKERSIGNGQEGTQRVMDVAVKSGAEVPKESEEKVDKKDYYSSALTIPPVEAQRDLDGIDRDKKQAFWTTIIAKEGNTVTELATRVYGWANQSIIELLGKNNPGIGNVNWIHEGERIFFPPLATSGQESTYTVHIASFKSFGYAQEMFQELTREQHDVYIIPEYDSQKGKIFRVTLGGFKDLQKAQDYASKIKKMGPMASLR